MLCYDPNKLEGRIKDNSLEDVSLDAGNTWRKSSKYY